tara:strand:- start:393 stop:1004 length:612 start_codon:yes stop_codon:yes gene_type:complete
MFRKILQFLAMPLLLGIVGCGGGIVGGDYKENLAKLDKVYGYCDNPQRNIPKGSIEYKVCKDKEAAAGADGLVDEDFKLPLVDDLLNIRTGGGKVIYASSVNKYLWSGSLNVLSNYPLKTADSNGGYLETEWIYDSQKQRCVIKIQINSLELVSNGVETKIICQNKSGSEWISNGENFVNEEKQITLAILSSARNYSLQEQKS